MKNIHYRGLFSLSILIVLITFMTACHDDNNNSSNIQSGPLSEQNFVDDESLRGNPEEGVVALFLEPRNAAEEDNLTGELGFDVIPYKYTRTLNHTFCFEDGNPDSEHFAILQDNDGDEVLRAFANEGCVTAVLQPGNYEVVLNHGEHVEGIEPVFLIPTPEDEQVAKRFRRVPSGFSKFFESISNVFTRPAVAQGTSPDNFTTLINTNACEGCDLTGVELPFADLSGAVLTFADLTGADFSNADLNGAILFETLLIGTNLSGTNLSGTDIRGSDLTGADLSGSDLTGAFLDNSFLNSADLTGADITDASFDFANLVGATWIDGSTCNISSIGSCNISDGDSNPCVSVTLGSTHDFNVVVKCLLPTVDKEVCTTEVDPGLPTITTCDPKDPEDLVTSVDLVDIFDQVSSSLTSNIDNNTPIAILAWGGEGGPGSNGLLTSGGDGGASGFASTVTTLSDFLNNYGNTSFHFYLAEAGTLSNVDGDGGSSTLVMLVESNPSSLDDIILIAGGGAGGSEAGLLGDGADGGQGGFAASSQIGQGFIGVGQGINGGADGGSTDGTEIGGNGTNDGRDGIGGKGGQGFLGENSEWINGDPDVGSDGRGGNADDGFSSSGGGGGGGGLGGGGAGDGEPGAGGGSWSEIPTITCDSAPNNDAVPSNPGTIRDSLFDNSNGAVEVWIFANGCSVN